MESKKIAAPRMKWGQYICWYNMKALGSIPNYSLGWSTADTSLPVLGKGSTGCCWLARSPLLLLFCELHCLVICQSLSFTGDFSLNVFCQGACHNHRYCWSYCFVETPDKDVWRTFGINLPAGSKVYWDHVLACREHGNKILTSGRAGWKLKSRLSSY